MRHRANHTERLAQGNTDPRMVEMASNHDNMHSIKIQEAMQAMMPPEPEGPPQ